MKTRDLLQLCGGLIIALLFGSFIGMALQVNGLVVSLVVFLSLFVPKGESLAYVSSLDLSALPGKMKDYALEMKDAMVSKLLVDTMPTYFTPFSKVRDEIPLTELVIDSIIQPGNKDTFDPQNNKVKFKSRIGKTRPVKVDLIFKPTQITNLQKSYLGLVDGGRIDPYTMPMEAYIFAKILKQVKNDVRLQALYKGVYNAAGTTPVDTMKGILGIIASDGIAGNKTVGAAPTSSNAYDEVQKLIDVVVSDANYAEAEMLFVCSRKFFIDYCRDYKATTGAAPYNTSFEQLIVEGTNWKFQIEPGLTGSNRHFVTPQENLCWLTNDESAMENIIVEYAERNIKVMMDFNAAPEIGIIEQLWFNDYVGIS